MSTRPRIRAAWLWAIILAPLAALLIKFTVYDSLRLAIFAHRVSGADRIVATSWVSAVSVTITGDDVKKVVRAVASAGSGRPPLGTDWANMYTVNVMFYNGAKVAGEIEMDGGGLFLIHHQKPPFREATSLLHDLVYQPVTEAAREAERKKFESQ